jgi:carboxylesterase type B
MQVDSRGNLPRPLVRWPVGCVGNGEPVVAWTQGNALKALRAVPAEKLLAISFRSGINVDGYALPDTVRNMFAQKMHNAVPVLIGSNANEMTILSNPAQLPATMDAYRQRVEQQYGAAIADYDAAYPVKADADIAGVLLRVGHDTTFTLGMRTWARMVTAAGKASPGSIRCSPRGSTRSI